MRVLLTLLLNGMGAHAGETWHVGASLLVPAGTPVKLARLVDAPAQLGSAGDAVVTKALAAGQSETLSAARLARLFRPAVAQARAAGRDVHLSLPKSVAVRATSHDLNAANVTADLIAGWQSACVDCRLEIENLNLPAIAGVRAWTIKTLPSLPKGAFSVPLELNRDSGAPVTGWVSGRLLVRREVPVANRLLPMGERLTADDFSWAYRDTAAAYDGIPKKGEVEGRKLRRGVANGDVLWLGTLERERAIHRGDLVQLRAGDKEWEVSLSVIAPQDAFVGDVVTFKNAKTNNVVVGRVTAPGQAEIQ